MCTGSKFCMAEGSRWYTALMRMVDEQLQGLSDSLRRKVRFLRLLRALTVFALVGSLGMAVLGLWRPDLLAYAFAVTVVLLSVPLMFFAVLLSAPLRAKSILRLIDKGYPENAKEIAIRLAARKLRDESIETEELLVETAWNESKKAYRKFQDRAASMRDDEARDGT